MATPSSRQGLIDYCLRKLGHPVVEVNVDEDQIEDRIDEAFQVYRDFHYDAVEKVYLKELMTSNTIAQQYVTLNDSIISVERVLQFSNKTTGAGVFDVKYQLMLNDIQSLTNTDIQYYSALKTNLQLINDLLTGQKPIRFNRHMNRMFIDMDWTRDVAEGDYIIIEAWRILDPDAYTDVYNDGFLKRYATALIKQQWGVNMKKFEGVQLPGGVLLNGQRIYDEATEEIKDLREEVQNTSQLPIDFFTG
jgi:hypothetical protein